MVIDSFVFPLEESVIVTPPVKDGLASGAYPVRLGMRLVVAIVLPPNVPVVQAKAPHVSVPVKVGLALGAQLLSCV